MSKSKKLHKKKYESNLAEIDEDLDAMMKEMQRELGLEQNATETKKKKVKEKKANQQNNEAQKQQNNELKLQQQPKVIEINDSIFQQEILRPRAETQRINFRTSQINEFKIPAKLNIMAKEEPVKQSEEEIEEITNEQQKFLDQESIQPKIFDLIQKEVKREEIKQREVKINSNDSNKQQWRLVLLRSSDEEEDQQEEQIQNIQQEKNIIFSNRFSPNQYHESSFHAITLFQTIKIALRRFKWEMEFFVFQKLKQITHQKKLPSVFYNSQNNSKQIIIEKFLVIIESHYKLIIKTSLDFISDYQSQLFNKLNKLSEILQQKCKQQMKLSFSLISIAARYNHLSKQGFERIVIVQNNNIISLKQFS